MANALGHIKLEAKTDRLKPSRGILANVWGNTKYGGQNGSVNDMDGASSFITRILTIRNTITHLGWRNTLPMQSTFEVRAFTFNLENTNDKA
ncbi:hypothetical protein E2C01_021607 [Portunus trituberculatus]|uniref:Uncharacterized protein n=1 Tax=Portunus trituberculatus TaxID=210409 RepID=A0A5B7E551_PORTR|nr:hypothetical protein [Portunus trituberculatus]